MTAAWAPPFEGGAHEDVAPSRPRPLLAITALAVVALLVFSGFFALGVWQLERRVWKLDLIERVEARAHAAPAAAPGPAEWAEISAERDEYRRVKIEGVLRPDRTAFVQAVTERGAGFWALTPLEVDAGFTLLVNRGFVPAERRNAALVAPQAPVSVTGLIRMSEPKGGFLRDNDPAADLWRSRDVAAIAASRGVADAAPYFIDADATPNPGGLPVGGLTVVSFRNQHLTYALTWFGLAAMTLGGFALVARHEITARRRLPR